MSTTLATVVTIITMVTRTVNDPAGYHGYQT